MNPCHRLFLQQSPGNTEWQRDVSVSLDRIGDLRRGAGDTAAALAAYDEGLEIARRLAAIDPGNTGWQTDVVVSLWRLQALSDTDTALTHLQEAAAILDALAQANKLSADQQAWPNVVAARISELSHITQVQTYFRDEILPHLEAANSAYGEARYRPAYDHIVTAVAALRAVPGGVDPFRDRLSNLLSSQAYYGVLAAQDQSALAAAQEAMELNPKNRIASGNLALAEMYLGETVAARARFLRHRGEMLTNGMVWEDAVQGDFTLLREIGRPHPLMTEIEAAFLN